MSGWSGASTCLRYHFSPDGLSVAKKTVENFVARAIRLYEQEPGEASRLRPAWVVCATVGQVGWRSSDRAISVDNQPLSAQRWTPIAEQLGGD